MRFTTIWTLPGLPLGERILRTRDWAAQKTGSYLPKRVCYWVTLHEIAKATRDSDNVPATPLEEILKNLDRPKRMH
jgi:hypothetical protein